MDPQKTHPNRFLDLNWMSAKKQSHVECALGITHFLLKSILAGLPSFNHNSHQAQRYTFKFTKGTPCCLDLQLLLGVFSDVRVVVSGKMWPNAKHDTPGLADFADRKQIQQEFRHIHVSKKGPCHDVFTNGFPILAMFAWLFQTVSDNH